VLDPITSLIGTAATEEVRGMVTRLIDGLKSRGVTAIFTTLSSMGASTQEQTDLGISSLVDTWILLRDIELNGERNRGLYILKSRGMPHSNQIREFLITSEGVALVPVYLGPEGVLTGSSRAQQEARARAAEADRRQELERLQRQLAQKRAAAEAQIAALRADLAAEEAEFGAVLESESTRQERLLAEERALARNRLTHMPDETAPKEVLR
jgi:circadian clock protein KaiC